ncbi:SpoIID/LytB domain-containing protein [Bacillus sp. 31A1R]|uniref:SpoIID/LytB domain-containing protein n=1 Tax=Robertmurraya mangrovi TaxID=3098077 RepID=A0ABU5IXM6_9BACI|nr:SpoIID/LytB domain-containing protein [Bacillus sp. 31A1R]MDZ5471862.1 SpoIID/LytB domain-containing protein [Bacillus sp. 31A1R]
MSRTIKILLSFILFLSCVQVPFQNAKASSSSEPVISVKLKNFLKDQTKITIKPTGDYLITGSKMTLKSEQTYSLKYEKSELNLYHGTKLIGTYNTMIATPVKENNSLSVNSRPYAGQFEFTTEKVGTKTYIRPINKVKMETYLKSVVPHEMYGSWPIEALKAQAVAARNYAITRVGKTIDDTINYQVYGGLQGHYPNSDRAVEETTGYVLKDGDKLAQTLYSASNGGVTESNKNAWGGSPLSYLLIKDDTFDPKTVWNITINKIQVDLTDKDLEKPEDWWDATLEKDKKITDNIKKWLIASEYNYIEKEIKVLSIPTLELTEPTSGGRVSKGSITLKYLVKNRDGSLEQVNKEYKNVSSTRLRSMIGNSIMLSYLVDSVNETTKTFKVEGRGNGHGVGLSQWGAMYRAKAGHSFEKILKFYYPGTTLTKLYSKAPTPDTKPPIIKDIKGAYDSKTNNVNISFNLNEKTKTTVYIKDNNSKMVSTLVKDKSYNKGTIKLPWNVSKIKNGTYTIVIKSADTSGNKSSATKKYKLSKSKYKTGKITATTLNIRQKPTTLSKVVGTVKKNQTVTIYSKTGSWYKIKYGKVTGYVHSKYVTNIK